MAVLNGIISKLNGSAGNLTFKQLGGKTIVSEKISALTDAKSTRQLKQRMKWANVIRMYQVLSPYLRLAFGGMSKGRTDYNKFVSANLTMAPVYLTKPEANAGATIVAPYQITQGTLNSIAVNGKGNNAITDIDLGTLTIAADTTIAQFSNAVVENNRDFHYGDQITYFLVHQTVNPVTQTPVADVEACAVVLDKSNTATLLSLVDDRGFAVQSGCLAAKAGYDFGDHGMAWVHSRKQVSKTSVSTQFLICDNALLSEYQSDAAYDTAATSYGGANEVFLSPQSSNSLTGNSSNGSSSGGSSNAPAAKYKLLLNASPAAGGSVEGAGEYAAGSSATIKAVANAGYTFSKWSDNDTNAQRTLQMTQNRSLIAYFVSEGSDSGGEGGEGGGEQIGGGVD